MTIKHAVPDEMHLLHIPKSKPRANIHLILGGIPSRLGQILRKRRRQADERWGEKDNGGASSKAYAGASR